MAEEMPTIHEQREATSKICARAKIEESLRKHLTQNKKEAKA